MTQHSARRLVLSPRVPVLVLALAALACSLPATVTPATAPGGTTAQSVTSVPPTTLVPPVVLATGQNQPFDIAVDGTHLYWASCGSGAHAGSVMRLAKTGGTPEVLATEQACASHLAVTAHDVYWLSEVPNGSGHLLWRLPLEGGTPEKIAQGDIRRLVAAADEVYWTECNAADGKSHVYKFVAGGAGPESLVLTASCPDEIALDADNVYWVESAGTFAKVARSGGATATLGSTQFYPQAIAVAGAGLYTLSWRYLTRRDLGSGEVRVLGLIQGAGPLAVDAENVYWLGDDGDVWRIAQAGGQAFMLARGLRWGRAIAVDDAQVYWVDSDAGTVSAVPKRSGVPSSGPDTAALPLAVAQEQLNALAADATHVYWTTCGTVAGGFHDGTVQAMPKAGGAPVVLATGEACPGALRVDEDAVYWVSPAPGRSGPPYAIRWVPRTTLKAETLATVDETLADMALGAATLYWSQCDNTGASGQVMSMSKGGGEAQTFAAAAGCASIALDERDVYWLGGGAVWQAAQGGGEPLRLANSRGTSLALDADALYWMNFSAHDPGAPHSCTDEDTTLVRMPRSGGEPAVLTSAGGTPGVLAVAKSGIYWTTACTQGLLRVDPSSGESVMVMQDIGTDLVSLVVDETGIYWANSSSGMVLLVWLQWPDRQALEWRYERFKSGAWL